MSAPRFDALAFVALFLIFFMGFKVFTQRTQAKALAEVSITTTSLDSQGGQVENAPPPPPAAAEQKAPQADAQNSSKDTPAVIAPYDEYTVTQGPHGFSYGQMAIDIAAGKGATIHSPITGKVTDLYVDQYGNPTLIIENNHYQILMMHGVYNVSIGQQVEQGDPVGKESNLGYTLDMQGNLCAGRDCGYHTHLNIFDKKKGENVNPLDVIGK
jgi:murein DD-endopeptidase MepM/ murein hydrolase activator NlpD